MNKYQNLINKRFGKLTVLELSDKTKSNSKTRLWKCKCDCGSIIYKSTRVLNESIKLNKTLSCGCMRKSNLIGKNFGDYEVVKFLFSNNKHKYWQCKCVCGEIVCKTTAYLTRCKYKCLKKQKEKTIINSKLKAILKSMKDRCYNKKNKSYCNYGAKNISICNEWVENPNLFVNWALDNGYKQGLEIDRIDNNGNYEPSNCRWVDDFVQANNKSNNINITYNGKTQSLRKWCRELQIPYRKTHKRLVLYKWSIERCFNVIERVGFI